MQEQVGHQHDEDDGDDECLEHLVDGGLDYLGGVERDLVLDAGRKAFLQLLHLGAHVGRHLQCIRARLLVDRDKGRRAAVQRGAQVVALLAFLCVADILEAHDGRAPRVGAQDEVVELTGIGEASLGDHREGHLDGVVGRRLTEATGAELLVLFADRTLHV